MELYLLPEDIEKLISKAVEIGFQKALETMGKKSIYISENKAFKIFNRTRVENWVHDERIKPEYSGNGRTSTKHYSLARLMELDISDEIKIKKSSD